MKHPNRMFERYKRSAGGSRTSQQPPSRATLMQSPTPQVTESVRPSERLPQQQQQHQYSSPQTGHHTFPSYSSTFHPHRPMDPPTLESPRNIAVHRNLTPPFTNKEAPTHRHAAGQSQYDRSDDPVHRWREIQTNTGSQIHHRNEISNQRVGNENTSNISRQTYDYSDRRDYNDNGDHLFTTSTTLQQSHTHNRTTTGSHPASVIISPNYDDDDDDHLPLSSISSRLSFEPWESVVQPPPFIHETDRNSNNYYNHPAPSATERRYNYNTDIQHEPLQYNDHNSHFEYYNNHSERVLPTNGFNVAVIGSNNNYTTAPTPTQFGATAVETETKMIEITPGNMERLRDAQETVTAIQNDFYVPCTCVYCDITSSSPSYNNNNTSNPREPIFCIQDAEYFLCPTCATINRLDVDHTSSSFSFGRIGACHMLGGVGLGFTMKTLLEVQRDYVNKHNRN